MIICGQGNRRKQQSHISHHSHRHFVLLFDIFIQLVTVGDEVITAAVPERDRKGTGPDCR